MEFKQAQRKRAKLRLGLAGPSGSGKTYSALNIANGITQWSKIAVIDSENGSAELYAHMGPYSVITLEPPYDPDKYIEAIHLAEQSGFEVIVVDSLSHAWNGEGGILDQQGKATDTKYRGNSWAAWREFTPKHNALVEAILKSPCHVIVTLRSKTEYAQVSENGKTIIKKLGLAPIQRDGMEYEFTIFLELSTEHIAIASKDRTGLFDGQYFKPNGDTGLKLLTWLNYEPNSNIVPEVMLTEAISTATILSGNISDVSNLYNIVCSEAKTKANGQIFAKVILENNNSRLLAWSTEPQILDIPIGTQIIANLIARNGTNIIESYNNIKGGEAA